MAIRVFSNARLGEQESERLRQGVVRLGGTIEFSASGVQTNLLEGASEPAAQQAQVLFGQPNVRDVLAATDLKLVQLTSAGWARYDTDELKASLKSRGVAMCNASHVYMEPCAEHLVGFMLSAVRQLAPAWTGAGIRWEAGELRRNSTLLTGQSVLLLGYGTIAERIAELLSPYRMKIKALRRNVTGKEKVPTFPIIAADELLPDADHVVNVLPGTTETAGFFDWRRFDLMKPTAYFYNIGRGTTVDQGALVAALQRGQLSGAYLDVTDPEPLPDSHELWTVPRCYITPHTAGGYAGEFTAQVEHLLGNLERWTTGKPLVDRVV